MTKGDSELKKCRLAGNLGAIVIVPEDFCIP